MTMAEGAGEGARVHWLVAGTFSPLPAGTRLKVSTDNLAQVMADAKLGGSVTVPDRLGAADKRTIEVAFTKPKSFQLTEIVASVPLLQSLRALAEDLGSADATKRPSPDAAIARLQELVGPGKLLDAVSAAVRPAGAPAAAPAAADAAPGPAAPESVSVDDVLAQGPAKPEPKRARQAATAVDAFVKAIRPGSYELRPPRTPPVPRSRGSPSKKPCSARPATSCATPSSRRSRAPGEASSFSSTNARALRAWSSKPSTRRRRRWSRT